MSQSYMDADGYAPVDQDLITDGATVQRVEPKTVWNPQTGRREQKTNRKGVPQWLVYVLFTPLPSDYVHIPQVVPVTVAADEQLGWIPPHKPVDARTSSHWLLVLRKSSAKSIPLNQLPPAPTLLKPAYRVESAPLLYP